MIFILSIPKSNDENFKAFCNSANLQILRMEAIAWILSEDKHVAGLTWFMLSPKSAKYLKIAGKAMVDDFCFHTENQVPMFLKVRSKTAIFNS